MNTKLNLKLIGLFGVVLMTMACTLGTSTAQPQITEQPQIDEVGTAVAATMQALTAAAPIQVIATETATQVSGIPVSFQNVSFVIPDGLASGADTELVAALDDETYDPWSLFPAHPKFMLTGYQLQNKRLEPEILVYPADEYARLNPNGAEQIDRLKKILAGLTPTKENLPFVPFYNSSPLITANIQIIPFQNGRGFRTLTQYGHFAGQITNRDLLYHFQGLTDDGKNHVIVTVPITAPILPESGDLSLPVPEGGVPFPEVNRGPNSPYYVEVAEKLNALSPDSYTPSLSVLDTLVQSILVAP